MLTRLSIRHIVLIESCDIAFKTGLCVLSGETGAGKSILLDALGLVLGARADTGLIRQGETQGSVTAEFDISANEQAKAACAELGLEESDALIIRRSLGTDGKTRCLINDQAVTAGALKKLGETLIEINGQHDQKTLQDTSLHRTLLDGYGKLAALRKPVAESYRAWRQLKGELEALSAEIEKTAREQDYLQHMRGELKQLDPQEGEEETLSTQRSTMMQSEKLFGVINDAVSELNAGKGVASALRSAQRALTRSPLANGEPFSTIIDAFERAAIEVEEASFELEKAGQNSSYSPAKLEEIEERLFALKAAGRKYNKPVDELAKLKHEVDEKLDLIASQTKRVGALSRAIAEARAQFVNDAKALSEARHKAAAKLQKAIEQELKPLKMENTRFRVALHTLPDSGWSEWGMDGIQFECATNVIKGADNVPYAPLNKIASGGELSRFMLAMKVALLAVRSTPTVIFDEIDTGTGGAVAGAIGQRLGLLGEKLQVLVVTHLPQVAARGHQHLVVRKFDKAKKVTTLVEELTHDQREEELARMLSGATITHEARKAAQKLLEEAA